MPNINDRIGSQNVIRVLSNASAPPTRLVNLTDVDSTLKTRDGMILVWDLATESFYMTDTIDSSTLVITGIATFSNTTNSTAPTNGALIVSGGLGVAKHANIGEGLTVAGVSTFASDLDINAAVDILNGVTANSTFKSVGVTTLASAGGITTTGGDLYIGGDLYVADDLVLDEITARNATLSGNLSVDGHTELDDVNIAGVTTFNNADVVFQGAAGGQNITFDASENDLEFTDAARIKFGNSDDLEIWHDAPNSNIKNSTGDFHIRSDSLALKTADNSERYLKATKNEDVKLYYNGNEKFATTGAGVTVLGTAETQQLNVTGVSTFAEFVDFNGGLDVTGVSTFTGAIDANGNLDVDGHTELDNLNVSGISTFTGAIDANGNLDVDGHTELDNLNVSGVSTFVGNASFAGNVSIAGTLTYEDVTNVDSIGFVTARSGIHIGSPSIGSTLTSGGDLLMSRNLRVAGVSTFVGVGTFQNDLYVGGDLYVADDISIDELNVRDANITGIATVATLLDVTGHAELDTLNVSGVSTFVGIATFSNNVFVVGTLEAGLIDGGTF